MKVVIVLLWVVIAVARWHDVVARQQGTSQQLSDGLLVTSDGIAREHTATWILLVTLDQPPPESELVCSIHHLRTMVKDKECK